MSNYLFAHLPINYYCYFTVTIITNTIITLKLPLLFTTSNCKLYEFIGFNSILITEKLNQFKLISFEDPLIY